MNSKKIGEVIPYLMDSHLLIALDAKWIDVFGHIPKFEVEISKGRLVISSPVIWKN